MTEQNYGALARDGVSCTVCHHIADIDLGKEKSFIGNFVAGPGDRVYGPYRRVVEKPMQHALGITPRLGKQIGSGDLCGSRHNVLLPVFDNQGNQLGANYEQSTHLEWLNSDFGPGRSDCRNCQDCHMPTHYAGQALKFKIANFESNKHVCPDHSPSHESRDSPAGA